MHFEELSPEICNLARLNCAFRGAASSDAVWEAKLPSNYLHLLQILSHPDACEILCKKDIFALLSRPHPFDDGNKDGQSLIMPNFRAIIFLKILKLLRAEATENHIEEKTREIREKDHAIAAKERIIKEKLERVVSLESDVASLQVLSACREQTHLPVSGSLHISVTFAPVLNPVA